jgi:glycine/D-amino acid oxidase-like deaminating enzyme
LTLELLTSFNPSGYGNAKLTLIEANHPASGASGKAGGLVARWAYPKELVEISFEEHKRLAKKWDGARRWGWREIECGSWEGKGVKRDNVSVSK